MTAFCKALTYCSRSSRLFCPLSPTSLPFTANTRKHTCFRSVPPLSFDGWADGHKPRNRPFFCVSSCLNLGDVVSSTAAATLHQLVIFAVDREDCRMLLANELKSRTLLDGASQGFGPAARDAFII